MTQPKWILAEVVIMSNITKSHGNNLPLCYCTLFRVRLRFLKHRKSLAGKIHREVVIVFVCNTL